MLYIASDPAGLRRTAGGYLRNSIKELRTAAGLTQEELGRRAGVSRQTVISIEGGRYDPSLALAMKLASLLGSRVEEIFFPEEA
jgi:putative transcriptional regulator